MGRTDSVVHPIVREHRQRVRRWIWGLLLVYVAAAALIVLSPVGYSGIVEAIGNWLRAGLGLNWFGYGWIEFVANILMLVPVGLGLGLLLHRLWAVVAIAFVASCLVEAMQWLIPVRTPSLRDVIANTVGAAVGVALAWFVRRRRPTHRVTASN